MHNYLKHNLALVCLMVSGIYPTDDFGFFSCLAKGVFKSEVS